MEFDIAPGVSELRLNYAEPPQWPLQPSDDTFQENNEDADIFRGDPPPRSPSPESIASSSPSSNPSLLGGRFTAIAAVVEQAISRWARAKSPSSSDNSSDNSSTRSSIMTLSRLRTRRRKRPTSSTNLRILQSERDLAAKYRAREESRHIPREFVLYLPPSSHLRRTAPLTPAVNSQAHPQRVSRTSSLPLILGQLDTALKRSAKTRRMHRSRQMSPERLPPGPSPLHQDYMLPDSMLAPNRSASLTDMGVLHTTRKGKERERNSRPQMSPPIPTSEIFESNRAPKAWWLDVCSPTWEDMRAIGRLLHLHPLTLEDILQQEPREKLELFPRLGYYFVSFRAIESQATRERFRRFNTTDIYHNEYRDDRGAVGEVSIYLVVFREGVCSFHFTDITEHTDRVRNRVTLLEETVNMSSDWIAHGILDSVVDSFFPFLEEVEKEVVEVEELVFSADHERVRATKAQSHVTPSTMPTRTETRETESTKLDTFKNLAALVDEKSQAPSGTTDIVRTRFSLPRPTIPLFFRRVKRALFSISIPLPISLEVNKTTGNSTASTLHRMARTRKLVTSLTRLLATKSEVVTQIRKRLLTTGQSGLGNGAGKDDDIEVAIYMGDVHDHILTLQHALAHYERMLSQSHPTYLSQLRVTVMTTKSGQDKAIMLLTIVSMAVLCNLAMIGVLSMNCNVPTNVKEPFGRYNAFGIVLALVFVITTIFLSIVRRWWLQAKRRRRAML